MGEIMSDLNEELRAVLHARENCCERLRRLPEEGCCGDYAGAIAEICSEYADCGEIPPEYSELLDKKFSEALEIAKKGAELVEQRKMAVAKLADEVKAILSAGELATLVEVSALEKRIVELNGGAALLEQLAPLKASLQAEADAEKASAEALGKLTAELIELTALEDITPLHDRKPQIEKEFELISKAPRSAVSRYQEAFRKAAVRLAQHYETLDLARWESYTLKLDICAELEKLCEVSGSGLGNVSKKLNEIREKWKSLGSVPKEKNEEINPRYLELTRKLQHRIDEYFAGKRQMQKLAAAEKMKICEQSEAIADSSSWNETAAQLRAFQEQWKTLERAGNQEAELFARFRAACDKFFTARKAAFDERDRLAKAAIARKKELIAEALNLTDVRRAKQLREEYRNSGSAGRREPELYKEFNAAMDKFFTGRREEVNAKEQRARELVAELENICGNPLESLERSREIREELHNIACRETRSAEQQAWRKFETALNRARDEERNKRIAESGDVAMELARCYKEFLSGVETAAPDAARYTGFPKLQSSAVLLASAIGGDEKAAEKLSRNAAAAFSEREAICEKLEELAGVKVKDAPEFSLAEELQNAMMGNFGKASDRGEKAVSPARLLADFSACGLVDADKLIELQTRIDNAMKLINGK